MKNATNEAPRTETEYRLAVRLRGFRSTTLRVRIVERHHDGMGRPIQITVCTADLLDAGTFLTLDPAQLEPEAAETVVSHRSGLVVLA